MTWYHFGPSGVRIDAHSFRSEWNTRVHGRLADARDVPKIRCRDRSQLNRGD
jgi:hypothetical protein